MKWSCVFTKLVIALFVLTLFNSCAIHMQFPFICFQKECVQDQWNFHRIKNNVKIFEKKTIAKIHKKKHKPIPHASRLSQTDNAIERVDTTYYIVRISTEKYVKEEFINVYTVDNKTFAKIKVCSSVKNENIDKETKLTKFQIDTLANFRQMIVDKNIRYNQITPTENSGTYKIISKKDTLIFESKNIYGLLEALKTYK